MWSRLDHGDQLTEEVDERHVHEHIIFSVNHFERSVVKKTLIVAQADFTFHIHGMRRDQ